MKICKADDVASAPVKLEGARDVDIRLLIHEDDGAPNFYMRQFNVAPGGHTPRHTHDWEHEVYFLAGDGAIVTADGEKPVTTGDVAYIAPNELHRIRNTGQGELKFLCLVPR